MTSHAERLLLLVVLLPLAAGLAQLSLGSAFGREGRWLSLGALWIVVGLALFLRVGDAELLGGDLSLRTPPPHTLRTRVLADLARLDRDGDGLLAAGELGRPLPAQADLDRDGALSQGELIGLEARWGDAWIAVAGPPLMSHADRPGLRFGLRLTLDAPGASVLLALALAGALLLTHMAPGGDAGDETGSESASGWTAIALAAFLGAVVVDGLFFAALLWQVGLGLVFWLRHRSDRDGAASVVGLGSFALLCMFGALTLGALLLALDPAGSLDYAALGRDPSPQGALTRLAAGCALLGALLLPCAVLALRPSAARSWARAQVLTLCVALPAGVLLLLRTGPLLTGLTKPLAIAGGALALFSAARALVADRLDASISWGGLTQIGGLALSLALAPSEVTLALTLVGAFGLAGLILAADSVRGARATWDLGRLGGLRRSDPALAAGLALAALVLVGLPLSDASFAWRGLLESAWAQPPAAVPLTLALMLLTAALVRAAVKISYGSPANLAPASPAPGRTPLPLFALATLTALAVKPIVGIAPLEGFSSLASGAALAAFGLGFLLGWGLSRGPWRDVALAPPGTWRGLFARAEVRLEALAPTRRVVQPWLRVAHGWLALNMRALEAAPTRASGWLWRRSHRRSTREAPPRPVWLAGALFDAGLFVLLLLIAWLAVFDVF